MSAHLYIEGGESKEDQIRCREGFRKLLEKSGFTGKMPRLTASGGRNATFDHFTTKHRQSRPKDYIAMLIDSEDPLRDTEKTWKHLQQRDKWDPPAGATDDQVLFMTTCMETWIVSDRPVLKAHYGHHLQESALPPAENLEDRHRHDVHERLSRATRNCSNAYAKGRRSFEVIGLLNPSELSKLRSVVRVVRILKERL